MPTPTPTSKRGAGRDAPKNKPKSKQTQDSKAAAQQVGGAQREPMRGRAASANDTWDQPQPKPGYDDIEGAVNQAQKNLSRSAITPRDFVDEQRTQAAADRRFVEALPTPGLMARVRSAAGSSPGWVLGTGALVGFLAGRFLRASARDLSPTDMSAARQSQGGESAGGTRRAAAGQDSGDNGREQIVGSGESAEDHYLRTMGRIAGDSRYSRRS